MIKFQKHNQIEVGHWYGAEEITVKTYVDDKMTVILRTINTREKRRAANGIEYKLRYYQVHAFDVDDNTLCSFKSESVGTTAIYQEIANALNEWVSDGGHVYTPDLKLGVDTHVNHYNST